VKLLGGTKNSNGEMVARYFAVIYSDAKRQEVPEFLPLNFGNVCELAPCTLFQEVGANFQLGSLIAGNSGVPSHLV
jgi:hypothetical protein